MISSMKLIKIYNYSCKQVFDLLLSCCGAMPTRSGATPTGSTIPDFSLLIQTTHKTTIKQYTTTTSTTAITT